MRELKDHLRVLDTAPAPDLWPEVQHRTPRAQVEPPPRRPSSSRIGAVVLALTVSVFLVSALVWVREVRDDSQAAASPTPSTPTGPAPCASESPPSGFIGIWVPIPFVGAEQFATLADAQRAAVADLSSLPRPQDATASDESITDVWVDPTKSSAQVCIDYASGVKVEYDHASAQMLDPSFAQKRFEQMASEDAASTNGQAQFVTIPGAGGAQVPAELFPDGAAVFANGTSQGEPGLVSFVASRYVVDVVGHESADSLLRIAASIVDGSSPT